MKRENPGTSASQRKLCLQSGSRAGLQVFPSSPVTGSFLSLGVLSPWTHTQFCSNSPLDRPDLAQG